MSKTVTYVGPEQASVDEDGTVWPGVRIPVDDAGTFVTASTGDVIELPDHIADEFVADGRAKPAKAKSAPTVTPEEG